MTAVASTFVSSPGRRCTQAGLADELLRSLDGFGAELSHFEVVAP